MVPQSLSYYRIQQEAFETMVTRSKNTRKLDYLSSLLLDRKDAKEIRLFNMFQAVIKKYIALFQNTRKDVDQVHKKQMGISTFSSCLSAVKYADKILFLQNGRVLGFDAHEKLIRTNADYRKMYNLQKEAYV